MTCPNCAGPLLPVAGSPETPPWLCTGCHRGWWPSELTEEARSTWNPLVRAFRPANRADARAAVAADLDAAAKRRTSLLPGQVRDVSAEALAAVADGPLSPAMQSAVAAELARRKKGGRARG